VKPYCFKLRFSFRSSSAVMMRGFPGMGFSFEMGM
jgi:hypothetical protein